MPSLFTPKFQKEKGEIVIKTAKTKGPNFILVCPLHYSSCDDEII